MRYIDFSVSKFLKIACIATILFLGIHVFFLAQDTLTETASQIRIGVAEDLAYYFYSVKLAYINNKDFASLINIFSDVPSIDKVHTVGMARSIPALLYHGLVDLPDGENITKANFEAQMFALKRAGWETVSMEDFLAFVRGEKELPNKSFLLTFDDGAKSSYYPVDPILRALGYRATSFIISGHSLVAGDKKSSYYLNLNELRSMKRSGHWDIQAHAHNGHVFQPISSDGREGHYYTNKIWLNDKDRLETGEEYRERVNRDIALVKDELKEKLDISSISFAFPYGDFAQNETNYSLAQKNLLDIVRAHYSLAFFQTYPSAGFTQNYFNEDVFLIKRIDVGGYWTDGDLLRVLDGGHPKSLPLHIYNFHLDSGWIKEWGDVTFKDASLVLRADKKTNGAAVVLDGTRDWGDYHFKAKVDWVNGESLSLVARYKDSKNFASCNISGRFIRIDEIVNGERIRNKEIPLSQTFSWDNTIFEISVHKDKIRCFIDGEELLSSDLLNQSLDHGGVGFKVWDPLMGNSQVIINQLIVEKIL